MAHANQERWSKLVDAKLRNQLVTRDNYIFNNRYEGDPKAGKVKIPVRDTEVSVKDYNKATGIDPEAGTTTYLELNIDQDEAVNELIDGFDAASKTAILASIGFSSRVTTDDVYQQGIRTISAEDISVAHDLGYTIKLLGIARNTAEGVDVRVHPTMIPLDHQLAKVSGAMNAVYVVGDAVGETMFYGAGAGSFPTASAVVGDILTLSEQISRGVAPLPESEPFSRNKPIRSMDELETKYYIRLRVADRVGALAEAVNVFAKHDISISLINQLEDGNSDSDACSVIFLTHKALEKNVQDAAAALAASDCVSEVANVLRIEDVDAWTDGVMAN